MDNQTQPTKGQIQVDILMAVRELKAQIQQLQDEPLNSKESNFEDYLNLFIQQIEEKVKQLEAEATQLKAQKKALYQQLWSQAKELKSCYQELQHTNQELCQALNSDQVSYNQAIAKKIFNEDEPIREALARLFQLIYGRDGSPRALGRLRRWTSPQPRISGTDNTYPLSKQAIAFKDDHDRLKARSLALKAQFQRLRTQSQVLAAQSRVLQTRYLELETVERDRN
ncbi:hypothetical protein H6F90_25095 [Trichocoleus sp. FACHB-591]|uniref:hypothetical protein n=1 Tax=Trichocoleus sp. FACHB-591 TaxID=2692872 RepID=UPI001688776B|nr:hypothetical protein [Trichocoleus sp. FACHB-591]MBD2098352.1 hypothetical protein [Trichocoleus sp. FACHB-591]